jgi:hypothetical protein
MKTRRQNKRWLPATLGALITLGTLTGAGVAGASPAPWPDPAPVPMTCRVIDFVDAQLHERVKDGGVDLTVKAIVPIGARLRLDPLVYIRQPEFWGIEVRQCPGFWPPMRLPVVELKVTMAVDGTLGTEGVEVIGATSSVELPTPGSPTDPAIA